jgi:hypothetical protein
MRPSSLLAGAIAITSLALAIAGCASKNSGSGFSSKGSSGSANGGSSGSPSLGGGGGNPTDPAACNPSPDNYDFPGNNCDDDGDGTVDNPATACDGSLPVNGDAEAFARAIGICTSGLNGGWGLMSATFTNTHSGSGAPNDGQHGILGKFGSAVTPREGQALGILSSGYAREYDDPSGGGSMFKGEKNPMQGGGPGAGALPSGFPKAASGCAQGNDVYDLIDVKLQVKVPANASGIQLDFNFWSGEWPEYVCTEFNDAFIAYLTAQGKSDNISFDSQNNPVSVNNGFFDRCTPNAQTGCDGGPRKTAACPGGVAELAGTGFDAPGRYCGSNQSTGGGATGWLTSKAPVSPGETITLELIIWDTGDPNYDSSVLIDHFQWVQGNVSTGTERPPK